MTLTLRRLLAVVLLVAPPLESGAAVALMSSSAHSGCTGHVCYCPPRPAPREACHGGNEGRASDALSGACHHDAAESPVLPATTPFLLSAAPGLAAARESGPAPRARVRDAAAGHLRLPLLPPRTA